MVLPLLHGTSLTGGRQEADSEMEGDEKTHIADI